MNSNAGMSKRLFFAFDDAVDAPSEPQVRAQLQVIMGSDDFPASSRNRRFLAHVVERSLRGEKTSGYEVATQVFGRPPTFNATADPIVRIEASKLRRDLETYYLKSGKNDRVRIDLPKGVYRAVFSFGGPNVPSPAPMPEASMALLRAALLGWAGEQAEAGAAWRALRRDYPDLLLDPRLHAALEKIHARDERVRDLLLEGLRRAAQPLGLAVSGGVAFAGGAG